MTRELPDVKSRRPNIGPGFIIMSYLRVFRQGDARQRNSDWIGNQVSLKPHQETLEAVIRLGLGRSLQASGVEILKVLKMLLF